jgi:hypothetical protein
MIFTDFGQLKPASIQKILDDFDVNICIPEGETQDFSTLSANLIQKTYFWPSKFIL